MRYPIRELFGIMPFIILSLTLEHGTDQVDQVRLLDKMELFARITT